MTRISTTQANLTTLNNLLRNQARLADAQNQVATGKKSTTLKGLVRELGALNAARAVSIRSQSTVDRIKELEPKLAIQDTALGQMTDAADKLRQSLIGSLGSDNGLIVMQDLQAAFDQLGNALNQKYAGRSLFAGTRTDVEPFTAKTLDEVAAAATVSELFQNSDVRQVSRIDDGTAVQTGILADDVASDLVSVIKAVKEFNDGAGGPFSGTMSAAQRTFIQAQLAALSPILDAMNQVQGQNGLLQNKVETAKTLEEERQVLMTSLIGDLQDADLAEAASRLQQAQTAVEASARTFSILQNVSLLNFLR